MNVCTPHTHIVIGDALITEHCTSSSSQYFYDDALVTAELVVYADRHHHHIVNGHSADIFKAADWRDLPEVSPCHRYPS
jgi:hypothetical protein